MEGDIAQHKHAGLVRTDMNCTNCQKNFIAEIDHDVNGDYIIHCPHCDHQHYRTIKDGVMTETRWGSDNGQERTKLVRTWKHPKLEARTTTASEFIRHRWLNFGK